MSSTKGKWLLNILLILLGTVFIGYLITRAHRGGNDINVYLFAAEQLLQRHNIYTSNPYNLYLYSPLFALIISPLTFLEMPIARVIWVLINVGLAFRLWFLLKGMRRSLTGWRSWSWSLAVIVLSLGFLNHNMVLGQVTILILWLTLEGLYQVKNGNSALGAFLIALGINFKIIPALALVYFGMKGHVKALLLTILVFAITLILPGFFVGFKYNAALLSTWQNVINPSGERFAFEDNDGCHSLNAILPAYFFDFSSIESSIPRYKRNVHLPRMIIKVHYDTLALILNLSRIALLMIFLGILLPRSWLYGPLHALPAKFVLMIRRDFSKRSPDTKDHRLFYWEFAFLCLITLLVFPHQMKYSMLYFVPVGAYVIFYFFKSSTAHAKQKLVNKANTSNNPVHHFIMTLSFILMFILAIMGREIVGNRLVDILDYYHFMGISNLIFIGILWYCRPKSDHESVRR